ncbi:Dityrosine transporter 1 [Ceratocystis platani]|uniref:Dityrosine transporter 1 n=1 Tax=Ceratocystis fimbriata f. sp. platani TaxID=88771 RepID=A0A0F8D2T5_CERFI|nr:Dityrosine transporter 1 [Ceratocystis platani]
MYMLSMGICPVIWGPLNTVYGRRPIVLICAASFFACSIGTALAPNLGAFFFFRIATAFGGTAFIIVGSACIGDIYRPTDRATALGWFLSGNLIGPALGPFMGGIIVTYTSWRVIFWLQSALAAVALAGSIFLMPETILHRKIDDLAGYPASRKARALMTMINPIRVIELYRYPNLFLNGIAAASMIWNMYSLLTPIRYILNPRFNLDSPMMGGLFYLAPGCGYLTGSFIGGRYADYTVRKWIQKRGGERIPEDRLRSAIPFMGIAMPACIIVYGWSVEKNVGGIPLALITLYLQGVAQLFCFPSINTYCLDVNQARSAEIIAGNYLFRYLFAAVASAIVLPAIDALGVGWYTTINVGFLICSAGGLLACVKWGKGWRDAIDSRRQKKRWETRMEAGKATFPLQTLAEKLALPIHERDTNTGWTPPFDYNLIVAVSFGLLIPPRLIRAAKYGGLNLHPSMLPDFRGAAPLHHTLLQSRSHIGVSLQTLHETSFDRGLVLAQTPMPGLPVSENCTLDDLNHLVAPVAAEMLVSGLRSCVHVAPQQSVGWEPPIGYKLREAPRLGKQDARMDWDGWTAEEAARRSRVLGPLWTYFSSPSGKVTRVQLTDIEWTARGGPIAELKSLSKIKLLSFASDSGTGNAAIVKPVWRTENGGVILEMKMGGHLHVKKIKLAGKKEQTPAWIFTKLYVADES